MLAFVAEDGKSIFLKYKCGNCHSVSTAGITMKNTESKAPDLVNITVRHQKNGGKDFVYKYIQREQSHVTCPKIDGARDGKLHMGGKLKGIKEEKDTLVDWLGKQRSK